MPLPDHNTPWPPAGYQALLDDMRTWEAWWIGDPQRLWNLYRSDSDVQARHRRRNLSGFVDRFFWGRNRGTTSTGGPSRGDLHIPIASDICATSADLLYSTPPRITAINEATSDQIERYKDDGLLEALITGAETAAALGGRYTRVTWDPAILARPFLSVVDADAAIPEFRWGRLVAVTFWTDLASDGSHFIRHLERHELDAAGNGVILHGLYEGTSTNLGRLIPLTEHPSTAPLAQLVNDQAELNVPRTPGLNVVYTPNMTPQRRWRHHPQGRYMGRSDLEGSEQLFDALDETYSAWMRDVRLAKARIIVDRSMLETPGGKGDEGAPAFDLDREVFTPLDGIGSFKDGGSVEPQQFQIRWQEHQQTALDLTRQIIRNARYSMATFGEVQDTDITATEVRARQATTETTRARKIRCEKPAVQALLVKMLRTDRALFSAPGLDETDISVDFPQLHQATVADNAQTVATLRGVEALSLQTSVELAHPDWDDTQIQEEVTRLQREHPLSSPDDWRPFNS
nr:MAG TPA: portal protein [Caudoviricetes sp.]